MAQSWSGLKLVTIAQGFDTDFSDLHPKRLRRITLGPMHSHSFTLQSGPIAQVLANARAPAGEDWALVWTIEELTSAQEAAQEGWFSSVPRQVFRLDPLLGGETGATRTERMIVLPERPYQALAELNPPGFAEIRKFVVGAGGRLLYSGRVTVTPDETNVVMVTRGVDSARLECTPLCRPRPDIKYDRELVKLRQRCKAELGELARAARDYRREVGAELRLPAPRLA